jgi:hypothetical protein
MVDSLSQVMSADVVRPNTLAVRRYYEKKSLQVRKHKLLKCIRLTGRIPKRTTAEVVGATPPEMLAEWLVWRQTHEPSATRQRKMESLLMTPKGP